ncbi:uncharacterized protein LOC120528326 [Polypterus senegalus]|uniref:uncharacterized protein LOC120528326 n=1 Tax=Polypterus senegalus TaxID=55291 RepID=UPI001963D165|nr:uncharacterized protein LOC120528326 [Polypterus senegalus]
MTKVLLIIILNILLVVWLKEVKGKPTEMVLVTFVFILLWVDLEVLANKSGEIYITLYLFGSTALIVVNSVALIIEMVILGNTGYRPVGDLVLIIVPFESLFLMCWNCLLLYRKRQLSKRKQESDFALTTTRLMKNARKNRNDNLNSQNADEPLQRRHTHERNEYSENNSV